MYKQLTLREADEVLVPELMLERILAYKRLKRFLQELKEDKREFPLDFHALMRKAGLSREERDEFLSLLPRFRDCLFAEQAFTLSDLLMLWHALMQFLWQKGKDEERESLLELEAPWRGLVVEKWRELNEIISMPKRGLRPKERYAALPDEFKERDKRKKTFAILRQIRQEKGITQAELAKKSGLRRNEISRIENGFLHGSAEKRLAKLRAYLHGVGYDDDVDAFLVYSELFLYATLHFRAKGTYTRS